MSKSAKVAVITRTRNRPLFITRAIQSILGQTFSDWIHIVVNDGGNPTLLEEAFAPFSEEYGDRLKIIHQDHSGMQAASNNGIKASLSDYIVIHDDDDSWHPDFLSETVAFLEEKGENSSYQGAISQTIKISESLSPKGTFKELERSEYVPLNEISLFRVGFENPFPPIAFLYRRKVHETIGLFEEQWDMVADLDFNFRFLKAFEIGIVAKPLAYYHWRTNKSTPANATNTVTAKALEHGQKLNELKNHYIREANTAKDAVIALGFQLSAFAVQDQWMTTDIRDKATESLHHLRGLSSQILAVLEQCNLIARFSEGVLWEKISEDMPAKFGGLKADLENLALSIKRIGDDLVQIHNSQSTITNMGSSLEQLRADLDQQIWPKIAEEIPQGFKNLENNLNQLSDTKIILESLRKDIDHNLWPKLSEDIPNGLEKLFVNLDGIAERLQYLNQLTGEINALRNDVDKQIWPKLANEIPESVKQLNTELTHQLQSIQAKQASVNDTLKALQNDKTLFQLGPFRISFRKSVSQET